MEDEEIVLKNIYCKTIHIMNERDFYNFDCFLFDNRELILLKDDFKYDNWLLRE